MKRIGLNVASALLAFSFGLCLTTLRDAVVQSDEVRGPSVSYPPPTASCAHAPARVGNNGEPRTPEDFRQFWTEFKSAVAREDVEALYGLTTHEGLVWQAGGRRNGRELCGPPSVSSEPPGLILVPDCYYLIKDRGEFALDYPLIFTRGVRRAILKREPIPNWPGSYILNVPFGGEPYGRTLVFVDEGRGFKFAGTWETFRGYTVHN